MNRGVLLIVWLIAAPAAATILGFDLADPRDGATIESYGHRAAGPSDAFGSYGVGSEGFTPNVEVTYGERNAMGLLAFGLRYWSTGYGDLEGIGFLHSLGDKINIDFVADEGFEVVLFGLDAASFDAPGIEFEGVRVLDLEGGGLGTLASLGPLFLTGTTHESFGFEPGMRPQSRALRLEIDLDGLGMSRNLVGIDNIRFGQILAPEPSTGLLMGLGLAGLAGGRRLIPHARRHAKATPHLHASAMAERS